MISIQELLELNRVEPESLKPGDWVVGLLGAYCWPVTPPKNEILFGTGLSILQPIDGYRVVAIDDKHVVHLVNAEGVIKKGPLSIQEGRFYFEA